MFKVAGKMFALSALERDAARVSVKCEPELAVGLRASYPAIRPGYHLNKRHWNTITLDGSLPDQLVRDLIEDSYDLVVSALPGTSATSSGSSVTAEANGVATPAPGSETGARERPGEVETAGIEPASAIA